MKKYIYATVTCLVLLLTACSDDNEPARTPVIGADNVTVSSTDLQINESMEIHFTGVADQVVIFTGDKNHEYSKLETEANRGFVVNKGLFTYAYTVPGTFHVVMVASTYDSYMAGNLQRKIYEFDVKVIDNTTTIDQLYSSITPNVYLAKLVNDVDWVLSLPEKQVYNGMEKPIKMNKLRLSFDIASDSSKIYIDDVQYVPKTYYDLTKPHNIKVESSSHLTRDYKLHTLIYPEFKSVTVKGVNGKLTRSAYDQDLMTYKFEGLTDEDMKNAKLDFTVDSNVKLIVNGKEVSSGANTNLTDPKSTYILRRIPDYNTSIHSDSRVVFTNK